MAESAARYLGFAFASADLLLEIDADDRVDFALGAARRAFGCAHQDLVGRSLKDLVAEPDQQVVAAVLGGLEPGARRGPVRIELARADPSAPRRFAGIYACRLPQNEPHVSCAINLSFAIGGRADSRDEFGLLDGEGFISTTTQVLDEAHETGLDLNLLMVELKGLTLAEANAPAEQKRELMGRVAAGLRAESYGGYGVARVGEEQFVLLREGDAAVAPLLDRIGRMAGKEGANLTSSAVGVSLDDTAPPVATLKALRFAIDRFLQEGPQAAELAFGEVFKTTVADASKLGATLRDHRFTIAYQPVVELGTGKLSHFEALLRLPDGRSPLQSVQMAEELDLITELDSAVLDDVIAKLGSAGYEDLRLAMNVSGRSLMRPRFVDDVLGRLAAAQGLSGRLVIEITETSAMQDLQKANAAIQRFRQGGVAVYIDDFGAGAANLAYLKALTVDAVKIDGQYISDIADSERNRALVLHVAKLCRDLGVETVAEHVESRAIADVLVDLRIRFGQGWLFGRPAVEPRYQTPAASRAQRAA